MSAPDALSDLKVHVKIKLAALWTSLMFCYIYGDYFGLFKPGMLQKMLEGQMPPLGPTTEGVLVFTTAMMLIPSLMVALSLLMRPHINRALNILFGALYTLIMLATMPGAWLFYIFLGVFEIALSLAIVYYAWTWPRDGQS